jgi:hypothetical protein
MTVNPKPIGISRFAHVVKEACVALTPQELLRLFSVAVMPYAVTVRYNEDPTGLHWFWVLARNGTRLLLYDDVEEYFSTGSLDEDGIMRTWQNAGAENRLGDALDDLITSI